QRGPGLMLRRQGGGSHVIQANAPPFGVTLAGLFATLHRWNALATFPRGEIAPRVLPTSSARVRTRTGRIKSMLPTLTAPFLLRLSISSIRFTRPVGAKENSRGQGSHPESCQSHACVQRPTG